MTNNTLADNLTDNAASPDESGEWVLTRYEPYHLPVEPPYHVPPEPKENGDESEGWVLTIYEPYCLPLAPDNP